MQLPPVLALLVALSLVQTVIADSSALDKLSSQVQDLNLTTSRALEELTTQTRSLLEQSIALRKQSAALETAVQQISEPCLPGFFYPNSTAASCEDFDECTVPDVCHPKASCLNTHGSFECECGLGFSGNGHNCHDVNECSTQLGHSCHANANCLNTVGSYSCECDASNGWFGNGTHCYSLKLPSGMQSYSHTCAILDYAVYCWGFNGGGRLGDGSTTTRRTPVLVSTLDGSDSRKSAQTIALGRVSSCVISLNSSLLCWGANGFGQLGDGSYTNRHVPTKVSIFNASESAVTPVAVSLGFFHACALTKNGAVHCWGRGSEGQLGDAAKNITSAPNIVPSLDGSSSSQSASSIACGAYHTCAITADRKLMCWGGNGYGQLGDGSRVRRIVPTLIADATTGDSTFTSIILGAYNSCGFTSSAKLLCWGSNLFKQLGDGGARVVPMLASNISHASTVRIGSMYICILENYGKVRCTGTIADYNAAIQVGGNSLFNSGSHPSTIAGLEGVAPGSSAFSLVVGAYHSCAVTQLGGLKCWGYNSYGQLGDGGVVSSNSTVTVAMPWL